MKHQTAVAEAEFNSPTPERVRIGDVIPFTTDRGAIKPARVEDPLDRYAARNHLTAGQYAIAREYGLLRWRAGLVPNAKASPMLDRVDGGGDVAHPIEDKADALSRLVKTDAKLQAMTSPMHVSVLAAVCAEGQPAAAWALAHGYRRCGRAGIDFLRDALTMLEKVWGRA